MQQNKSIPQKEKTRREKKQAQPEVMECTCNPSSPWAIQGTETIYIWFFIALHIYITNRKIP